MSERVQFRRVHEITGAFVLLILLALVGTVVWTGRSQRWFKGSVPLRIVLPDTGAAGIRQGSEVYFLGTRVGSVADVLVDATGRMEAETNIRRDFFLFVRADSSAVVKKKFGVAGDAFFEITRGQGRQLSEYNASIVCNEQFQNVVESAVEEVRREALEIIKKANHTLDVWTALGGSLNVAGQRIESFAARGENLAQALEEGRGTLGQLIASPALSNDVRTLFTDANATVTQLLAMSTNLNRAAQDIQTGAARLPQISEAVANEASDLPGLVNQTQTSMRELQRLTDALQRHWLVRKYINKTNPPPTAAKPRSRP
jgi:phospholipid/cholesterol/gamma-HCH transport system substrate-binding protein